MPQKLGEAYEEGLQLAQAASTCFSHCIINRHCITNLLLLLLAGTPRTPTTTHTIITTPHAWMQVPQKLGEAYEEGLQLSQAADQERVVEVPESQARWGGGAWAGACWCAGVPAVVSCVCVCAAYMCTPVSLHARLPFLTAPCSSSLPACCCR